MSRDILNTRGVYINTIKPGEAIDLGSESTSQTINFKPSKQSAVTSIADTDIFVLESSNGTISKITGANMKSELEQSSVVSPLFLSGNVISIKGLSGFTANKLLRVNSNGDSIEYVDDYTAGTNILLSVGNQFSLNSTISNNILFTGTISANNHLEIKGESGQVGYINFYDTGTTNHVSLLAPTNVSGSHNVILPNSAGTVALTSGNITGNSDTATKIASITNSNIVQLTTAQTLTNKTFNNTTTFNADLFLSGGTGLDFYDADNLLKITLEGQGDLTQNHILTLPKLSGELATLGDISSGESFGTNSSSSVEVGNTSNVLELKGSSQITYNATLHNFETGLIKTQTKGMFIGNDNANALNTEVGINHSAATANGISFFTCFLNENQIGDVRQQTNNSVSFNTSSDYRLKTNIEDVNCLELVNKLKVKKFNFKSDLDLDIVGFIAHEVQEVDNLFGTVVSGSKDEMSNWDNENKCWTDNKDCECKAKHQSIDYGKLTPFNTRAIQELYSIIQQQQVVINNLLSSTSFKDFKSK